jgi:hypothetical protein
MRHQITFHDGYFESKTWGKAVYDGFVDIMNELTSHPKWKPGMPVLADHRELDISGIEDFLKIESIASIHVKRMDVLGRVRIAVLIKRGATETYIDLWRTICNYFGFPVEHQVFFDREEALRWLMSQKVPAP